MHSIIAVKLCLFSTHILHQQRFSCKRHFSMLSAVRVHVIKAKSKRINILPKDIKAQPTVPIHEARLSSFVTRGKFERTLAARSKAMFWMSFIVAQMIVVVLCPLQPNQISQSYILGH